MVTFIQHDCSHHDNNDTSHNPLRPWYFTIWWILRGRVVRQQWHAHCRFSCVGSARAPGTNAPSVLQINSHTHPAHTYTIDGISQKVEPGWDGSEGKKEILPIATPDLKNSPINESEYDCASPKAPGLPVHGVKITVDREIAEYDPPRTK
jgi:hypothetical protein